MARIWVVDDEPFIRHAIVSVLEDLGHQSEGFGDAEELYNNLVNRGDSLPELLILDHMLPDESGARSFTRCVSAPSTATYPCCS